MTATVPQQGSPTTGGPTLARRLGLVYGYRVLDPATGDHPTDYVGQTIQTLAARDRQHRGKAPNRDGSVKEQPWSDLIVGQPYVIEQGFWTAAELNEREQYWITTLRPRYNVALNYGNPARIKPWEAQEARRLRDTARGVVTPAPVPPRRVDPVVPRRSLWRWLAATRVVRSANRRLRSAVRQTAPWLLVAAVVWVLLLWQGVPAADAATGAGIAAVGLWAGWRHLTKPKKARTSRATTRRRTK